MAILICIAGFRYNLGIDTLRYQKYYETYISTISQFRLKDLETLRYQPLYNIFCSLCKTIIPDFWFFQLCHALFVNSIIFYFFKKYTKYVFVAVCLYSLSVYLGYNMETMRASCAVAMMLLGYDQFKEGRKIYSLVFFIASYLFHVQAIILLPTFIYLLFADNKVNFRKRIIVVLLFLVLLMVLSSLLIRDNLLLFAFTSAIGDKIDIYSATGFESSLNWKGIVSSVIATLTLPAIIIYSIGKQNMKFKHDAIILLTLFIFLLCIPLSIFYRFKEFVMPFMIILMSDAFGLKKLNVSRSYVLNFKSFFIKCLIIILPYFWVGVIGKLEPLPGINISAYWEYYPYSSIFDKTDYLERSRLLDYYLD